MPALGGVLSTTSVATSAELAAHEADTTAIHGITDTAALATAASVSAHTGDTSDAHDASAVSVVPFATIAATDVQGALEEIVAEVAGGGAPTDAQYLVAAAHAGLSAEVVATAAGLALLDDADAAAQRTTLGLGTAAVAASGDFEAAGGITTHAGAADPHTGYRLESADHTHASTGLQGGPTLNPTGLQLPTAAGISLIATEGYIGDDSTTKQIVAYDSQRQRAVASVGWVPYAFPLSYDALSTVSTSTTLAAAGGTVACPVLVPGHMLLQALRYRQGDSSLLRTMEWQLYVQDLNNANAGENTLRAVTGATGTDSLTAAAASTRTSAVTSPPIYLAPGLYWCVVRNTSATETFAIQGPGAGTMQNPMMQTKTLGSALGSTLDFVAATWTKVGATPLALILQGRVFGQTAAF